MYFGCDYKTERLFFLMTYRYNFSLIKHLKLKVNWLKLFFDFYSNHFNDKVFRESVLWRLISQMKSNKSLKLGPNLVLYWFWVNVCFNFGKKSILTKDEKKIWQILILALILCLTYIWFIRTNTWAEDQSNSRLREIWLFCKS